MTETNTGTVVKKSGIYHIGFVVVFFILLSILSEIVYAANNDPILLRSFFLEKSVASAKNDSPHQSLEYLLLSAGFRAAIQSKKYPNIAAQDSFKNYKRLILDSNYDKSPYIEYLRKIEPKTVLAGNDYDSLRIFYDLALIAKANNYKGDILPFLKIAMIMQPELSHLHLEIANYYLLNNDLPLARKQIEKCMELQSPKKHCRQYLDGLDTNPSSEIGFLQKSVNEQYR